MSDGGPVTSMVFEDLTPPSIRAFDREWDGVEREALVPMTCLTVRSGSCHIEVAQRRMLIEVDLTALGDLPGNASFTRGFFLKRVRLPLGVTRIPSHFFDYCQLLCEVNTGDCIALREIGESAFTHCWALQGLEIPAGCREVYINDCGVQVLDVGHHHPTTVGLPGCASLKALRLPRRFRGDLNLSWAVSLKALTIGTLRRLGVCSPDSTSYVVLGSGLLLGAGWLQCCR
jgi:hypothetical protein